MQAPAADVVHRRLPAFGHEPRMQARAGQPGDARQVGDLQRVSGVLLDVRIQRGVGQAPAADEFGGCALIEAGQQQHRALLRDQRITDRAVRQPTDQLALPGIQRQARRLVEQAAAGIGMLAQRLRAPIARRAHPAPGNGCHWGCRRHGERRTGPPRNSAGRTWLPRPSTSKSSAPDRPNTSCAWSWLWTIRSWVYWRRVRIGRIAGLSEVRSPVYTDARSRCAVTGLTRTCHGRLTGTAQAGENIAEGCP